LDWTTQQHCCITVSAWASWEFTWRDTCRSTPRCKLSCAISSCFLTMLPHTSPATPQRRSSWASMCTASQTSSSQPTLHPSCSQLDQVIIAAFKAHYRSQLVQFVIRTLNNNPDMMLQQVKIDAYNAVRWVQHAAKALAQAKISKRRWKAGILVEDKVPALSNPAERSRNALADQSTMQAVRSRQRRRHARCSRRRDDAGCRGRAR
jgi:hypothetical protein